MNIAQTILVWSIRLYRVVISPLQAIVFGPGAGCRFSPTCSCYGIEAVQRHGALKGLWLIVARLAHCHPWGGCGDDPVPETFQFPFFRHSKESPGKFHFLRRPGIKA